MSTPWHVSPGRVPSGSAVRKHDYADNYEQVFYLYVLSSKLRNFLFSDRSYILQYAAETQLPIKVELGLMAECTPYLLLNLLIAGSLICRGEINSPWLVVGGMVYEAVFHDCAEHCGADIASAEYRNPIFAEAGWYSHPPFQC